MRRFTTQAFLIALTLTLSFAGAEARSVTVKGEGGQRCSQWTQDHKGKKANAFVQETWLAGFITAFNAYGLKEDADVAAGVDLKAIQSAVSTYCAANPDADLFKAATNLISDFQKKSGAK